MEVSGQIHTPAALPPGKEPRYQLARRLAGPETVWTWWRREKNLCPFGETNAGKVPWNRLQQVFPQLNYFPYM